MGFNPTVAKKICDGIYERNRHVQESWKERVLGITYSPSTEIYRVGTTRRDWDGTDLENIPAGGPPFAYDKNGMMMDEETRWDYSDFYDAIPVKDLSPYIPEEDLVVVERSRSNWDYTGEWL